MTKIARPDREAFLRRIEQEEANAAASVRNPPNDTEEKSDDNDEKLSSQSKKEDGNELLIQYLTNCGLFVSTEPASSSGMKDGNGTKSNKVDIEDIDESSLALLHQWSISFSTSATASSYSRCSKNKNDGMIPLDKMDTNVNDNRIDNKSDVSKKRVPSAASGEVEGTVQSSSLGNISNTNNNDDDDDDGYEDSRKKPTLPYYSHLATASPNIETSESTNRLKMPPSTNEATLSIKEGNTEDGESPKDPSEKDASVADTTKTTATTINAQTFYNQISVKHNAPKSDDKTTDDITNRKNNDENQKSDFLLMNQMIVDHLKENNERMKRLEDKMDALAQLVVALSEQRTSSQKQYPLQTHQESVTQPSQVLEQQDRETIGVRVEPRENWLALWWQTICVIPKNIVNQIKNSFPIRLWTFLKQEYHLHPEQIQIRMDWFLLFKYAFVASIFSNSSSSRSSSKGNSFLSTIWIQYRLYVFLVCSVIIYLFQCGIIQFLHRTLIEEDGLSRTWNNHNNDDLPNNDDPNADNNINNQQQNRPINAPRRRARDRDIHLQANNNNQLPQQDRNIQDNNREVDQNRNDEIIQNHDNGGLHRNIHPNFVLRGNIFPREGGPGFLGSLMESFQDLKYLFGSFFLSLLPMWRPEPVLVPDQQQENNDNVED